MPRLLVAGGVALSLIALVTIGGWKLLQSASRWVDGRPEHQIQFSQIELSPPPDPCVFDGKSKILEEVRIGANLGKTISLLELNLKEWEQDLSRCAWVKKVIRVDRSHYGRLIVELEYRKPVAVVVLGKLDQKAYPIDEEGVALPTDDIDWTAIKSPFRVRGIPDPMIEIRGLIQDKPPSFGVPWKKPGTEEPEELVLEAARLAEFLQKRGRSTPKGRAVPVFAEIRLPAEPGHWFFLRDSQQNWVYWGKPPGDEKPGETSSEDRWKMLVDWIDQNGPLDTKSPRYLLFNRTEASVFDDGAARKRPKSSRSGPEAGSREDRANSRPVE